MPHQAPVRRVRVVAPSPQPCVHGELLPVEHHPQGGVIRGGLPRVALGEAQPSRPGVGQLRAGQAGRQFGLDVPRIVIACEGYLGAFDWLVD